MKQAIKIAANTNAKGTSEMANGDDLSGFHQPYVVPSLNAKMSVNDAVAIKSAPGTSMRGRRCARSETV